MQHRYSGDVGDFGKIGLLKSLFDSPKYNLGMIWYLFPDESHNDDGRHIDYLDNEKYITCDKELANNLACVTRQDRSVFALEKIIKFSNPVTCYSNSLDFHKRYPSQKKTDKESRLNLRKKWIVRANEKMHTCNAIFLDPDNGLEVKSCSQTSQLKAGKYTYYSEIEALFRGKNACVIYHHLSRSTTHQKQINKRCHELRKRINPDGRIYALRFNPYSPRAYFILTDKSCQDEIRKNIKEFMASSWSPFWDSYCEN